MNVVKMYLMAFTIFSISFCSSCQFWHPVMEIGNETILKNPKYRLEYTLDEKGMQLIDTSSIYVYQNEYFKFYSNGEVIRGSMFYRPPSNKQSLKIHANSVYRGRYELLDDNRIKLELYYPGLPSIYSNGWLRTMLKGVIVGNTIKVKSYPGVIDDYVSQENWR
jgi:hypothetical protein